MAALRHIAAIRARLLQSTDLVPILALRPSGKPAIYLGHVWDVQEPVFPCVTLRQADGNLAVWAKRLIDPGHVIIDFFSKKDNKQPSEMEEMAEAMLHGQKTLTSMTGACFHEIRKEDWGTAMWDSDTHAWRATAKYLIRVSVS